MKKIVIILFLIISSKMYAEVSKLDSIFIELDHSVMHTKYLWDKQIRWVDPLQHKGNIANDTLNNLERLIQLSQQFSYSNVTDTSDYKDFEQMDSLYALYQFDDTLTVSILFAAYDKFDDSSAIKGYVYEYNEQFFDSVGRVTNPYELHHCFISALSKDTVLFYEIDSVYKLNFIFPNDLQQLFPNLDSISIDFNTGLGSQIVLFDAPLEIEFDSLGLKTFLIRAFLDSLIFESEIKLELKIPDYMMPMSTNYNPPHFDFPVPLLYGHSGLGIFGKAHVWLSCPDNQTITRPFIIVEGFDPLNKRDGQFYQDALDKYGDYFHSKLLNLGYDVILLDFSDGGNFIEFNALCFKSLLDILNNETTIVGYSIDLKTDIRVMGISMGGVVSRWALSWMEDNNHEHNVGLWFTVDSPHQGAYIPWALRNFLVFNSKYLAKFVPSSYLKKNRENLMQLKSLAGRQMLISSNSLLFPEEYDNSNDFDMFYSLMHSLPFPSISRNFAITNGNLTGKWQQDKKTPSNDFLPVQLFLKMSTFAEINVIYIPGIGLLPLGGGLTYYTQFTSLPQFQYNPPNWYRYYKQGMGIWGTVLGFKVWKEGKDIEISVLNNTPSYETIPGGYRNDVKTVYDNLEGMTLWGIAGSNDHYWRLNQCFIPTASSIDIRLPNGTIAGKEYWKSNIKQHLSNGTLITPFDKIYGLDDYNTPHALGEYIDDFTIRTAMENLLNEIWDKELAPINLYLQNETLISGRKRWAEARERVYCGREVTTEKSYGDFVVESGAELNIRAGNEIIFKPGTFFKAGSKVHAKIEDVFVGCFEMPILLKTPTSDLLDDGELITNNTSPIEITVSPNPFDYNTTITVTIPEASNISLTVYDMLGRKIEVFADNEHYFAGEYTFTFSGQNLNSGMFYVGLISGTTQITKPLMLIK